MTTDNDGFAEAVVVFLGRCKVTGGKLGGMFITHELLNSSVDAQDVWNRGSPFAMKEREIHYAIGGIYKMLCKIDANGCIHVKRGRPEYDMNLSRSYHVKREWIVEWSAMDELLRVQMRSEKMHKKLKDEPAILNCLKPLINAHKQTDRFGKLVLEAIVIDALRRGYTYV